VIAGHIATFKLLLANSFGGRIAKLLPASHFVESANKRTVIPSKIRDVSAGTQALSGRLQTVRLLY
jgi:hypothetical protein